MTWEHGAREGHWELKKEHFGRIFDGTQRFFFELFPAPLKHRHVGPF